MTTNHTANYIANRGVTKHMSRHEAITIWKALKAEGWTPDKNRLVKDENCFVFTSHGNKTAVNHLVMEVAS
jgi:hypothetical protein